MFGGYGSIFESTTTAEKQETGKRSSVGHLDNVKCPYCSWSFTSRVARTLSCGHAFYFCENCLPAKSRIRCMKCMNVTEMTKELLSGREMTGNSKESSSHSSLRASVNQVEKEKAKVNEDQHISTDRNLSSDASTAGVCDNDKNGFIEQNEATTSEDETTNLKVSLVDELQVLQEQLSAGSQASAGSYGNSIRSSISVSKVSNPAELRVEKTKANAKEDLHDSIETNQGGFIEQNNAKTSEDETSNLKVIIPDEVQDELSEDYQESTGSDGSSKGSMHASIDTNASSEAPNAGVHDTTDLNGFIEQNSAMTSEDETSKLNVSPPDELQQQLPQESLGSSRRSSTLLSKVSNLDELCVEKEKANVKDDLHPSMDTSLSCTPAPTETSNLKVTLSVQQQLPTGYQASTESKGSSRRSSALLSKVSNLNELRVEKENAEVKEDQCTSMVTISSEQNKTQTRKDETSNLKVALSVQQQMPTGYQSGLDEEYQTKREYVSKIRALQQRLKAKTIEMKEKEEKLMGFSDELVAEVEAGRTELSGLKHENEAMSKTLKYVHTAKLEVEGKLAESLERIESLEKDSSATLKLQEKLEKLESQISNYGSMKEKNEKLEEMLREKRDKLPCLVNKLSKSIRGLKGEVSKAKSDFVKSYASLIEYEDSASASLEQRFISFEKESERTVRQLRKEQILRQRLFNEIQELKGNIRIFVRVRPMTLSDQKTAGNKAIITCKPSTNHLVVDDPRSKKKRRFVFDKVFSSEATQEDVFQEGVKAFVTSAMDGYNVSILAYGQTGSGKTYTMTGKNGVGGASSETGLHYRALREMFRVMEERSNTKYELSLSVMEIYNDNIRDLLGPRVIVRREADLGLKNRPTYLKIRTKGGQMFVEDLTEIRCNNLEDVVSLMKKEHRCTNQSCAKFYRSCRIRTYPKIWRERRSSQGGCVHQPLVICAG